MMSLLSNVFDATIVGSLRKPIKQATGMSDAQLALAAAAAATGGVAAGGAGLLGGSAAAGGAAAPAAAGASAAGSAAPVAAAGPAASGTGLLGTTSQALMAANAARGLLGNQQQPIQAQPVMQAQGGAQTLQGIAAQGDQMAAQRMQDDEQARQARRMAMMQGVRNGRIA